MRFRLTTIFYVTALIGAAIAAFGTTGIFLALLVFSFWVLVFSPKATGKGAVTITTALVVFGLCLICCCSGLLPGVQSVREAARKMQCANNLRQIGLALYCYEAQWGCLPPAYVADDNGKPMHSWRVLLLPHIEEQALYDKYDFSEPWDGPNNGRLADNIPHIYRCASQSAASGQTETPYLAVVGPNTMWPGTEARKLAEVPDGASNTLLVVEAAETGIHWMEPRDLTVEEFLKIHASDVVSPQTDVHRADSYWYYTCQWNAVFADSHIQSLSIPFPKEAISAFVTVDGGEPYKPYDFQSGDVEPHRYWRWGRVVATAIFVLLCLLPLVRFVKRGGRERDEQNEVIDPNDESAIRRS